MTYENEIRGNRAEDTLGYYAATIKQEPHEPTRDNLTDLLTDLMHFCEVDRIDFEACLRMAEINFGAELGESEE